MPKNFYKKYKYQDKLLFCYELAEMAGCTPHAMRKRINKNKGVINDDVMYCSTRKKGRQCKKYEYQGGVYTLKELADIAQCRTNTMYQRIIKNNGKITAKILQPNLYKIMHWIEEDEKQITLVDIARKYPNLNYNMLYNRHTKGKKYQKIEDLIKPPYCL